MFDEQLDKTLRSLKSNVITHMGDFNAKIGEGRRSDLVSDHVLSEANELGTGYIVLAKSMIWS